MDEKEASEDECLDLEALEALLDEDDNITEDQQPGVTNSLERESESRSKCMHDAEIKSVKDFLDAASDSDEDLQNLSISLSNKELRSNLPCSGEQATNSNSTSEGNTRGGLHISKLKTSDDFSHKTSSPADEAQQAMRRNQDVQETSQCGEKLSVDSTTEALRDEMLKMQRKMLELQQMLENRNLENSLESQQRSKNLESQQRSKNLESQQRSKNLESEQKSKKFKSCKSFSDSSKKVDISRETLRPNSSSKKIFQEQVGKQSREKKNESVLQRPPIKLLDESGDSPFFNAPPKKSSSVPQPSAKKREGNVPVAHKSGGNNRKQMEKALFGDSDSDWEDMDGEDKQTLSEAGVELKRIMNSREKARVAHTPKFGSADFNGGAAQSWARYYSELESDEGRKKQTEKRVKNTLQCKASSSDQTKPSSTQAEEEPSVTEAYSKIRIINPLISSSLMKMRMEGRKMISVPKIHLKMKTQDVQGDWVTIGVVVNKSDPKTSSSGKPYSIWKLNDLEDLETSVSFFLFGEVHKQLWKTELGTVLGVLNPAIMDAVEKNGEPAFTIKNPSQMMVMGRSKDLGWCTSRTKGGNKCCKFINRRMGEFCAYHVQAAYRKTSATRLELHGSVAGVQPKSFEKKIFSKDCAYTYGGQTFIPNSRADSGKTKKGMTLSKLQRSMTEGRYQKVNTLSIHDIKPPQASSTAARGKIEEGANDAFLDMIAMPSAGSMNFVAHLKNQDKTPGGGLAPKARLPGATGPIQSVSAKDLMKKHKQEMDERRLTQKRQRADAEVQDPLEFRPQLGKGLGQNREILLGGGSRAVGKADVAKLRAIATVKQMGGLERLDPNAVKKSGEKVQGMVRSRVEKDCGGSSSSSSPEATVKREPRSSSSTAIIRSPKVSEPPKKKSKLLGDVDLNSEEVKSILKARSKHKGVLAEAEAEREEAYFTELEKKEKLEEKMLSVTSIEITVVTCKQCMYTAQSARDSCKKEGHALKRSKAKKRFFMCKKCKQRTYVIDTKFPTEPCRKCGEMSYEKTSMCPVRSGPKLDSEVLSHRGDEVKYLSSLDQKVYLNTVIDH